MTLDEAHTELHAARWAVGEITYRDATGRTVWRVEAHRDEEQIIAEGRTQTEA